MKAKSGKLKLEELLRVDVNDERFTEVLRFVSVILRAADTVCDQDGKCAYHVLHDAFKMGFPDGAFYVDDTINSAGFTWSYEGRHTHCVIAFPPDIKATEQICYEVFTRVVRYVEIVWCYVEFVCLYRSENNMGKYIRDFIDYELEDANAVKKNIEL